jgi:hypothetical protein
MTIEEYLASIDWVGAIVVAVVVVAVGLVALRFLVAATSEVGTMLPGAVDATGRRLLDARTDMPVDSWVCTVCRSVNTPTATRCYVGCGPREEVAQPLPGGSAPSAPEDDDPQRHPGAGPR